jgi:hypothetical protein
MQLIVRIGTIKADSESQVPSIKKKFDRATKLSERRKIESEHLKPVIDRILTQNLMLLERVGSPRVRK